MMYGDGWIIISGSSVFICICYYYPESLRLIRHRATTVSRSGLILGGLPKFNFLSKQLSFPGSAQKCPESLDFVVI